MPDPLRRHLTSAELLSIGTELTVGDTRDTNAGELARSLTGLGVRVERLTALPDDLDAVTEAFRIGLSRADLVVSTGGLGPTPDDLTREAIAAASGETPVVDPELEAWLRELWSRRGMPFPEINLKQAWLIPSAAPLPNPNGTAPGWFVARPDGRVIVAMPGPPREMRPMWADHALPRLQALGLGADVAARTYRLTGIGESQLADRLGEALLRTANPIVATYARVEAVDVRVSATADGGKTAEGLVEETAATVLDLVGEYVWATGETTWSQAIGARLAELGWTLAAVEIGTAGAMGAARRRHRLVPVRRGDRARGARRPGACGRSLGRRRGRRGPAPLRAAGPRARRERGRRGDPGARANRRHGRVDRRRGAGHRAKGAADRLPDRADRAFADRPGRGGLHPRDAPGCPRRDLTDTWRLRR